MQPVRKVPNNPETMAAILKIVGSPWNEKPSVEMTDETARDIQIIWSSIQACHLHWRGGHDIRIPDLPQERIFVWADFAKKRFPECLPIIKEFTPSNLEQGKLAIELGCGNSPNVKFLLDNGWRVTAIDSSQPALAILTAQHKSKIDSGILKVVHADVTAYIPEEPADLVIAEDVLPFVDPSKFQDLWVNIHQLFV